jgi:Zn-dependent protease
LAVSVLTIAFFWLDYRSGDNSVLYYLGLAALSVVVGFLIHELSHKVVARKYGCWAEFRADYRMLGFALLSSFLGFLFAAPGAVMIAGKVTREQNGKISLAGPGSNFLAAIALMPFALFTLSDVPELAQEIAFNLYFFSVFLGAFNMIPFMPLDGAKIWAWSKPIYIVTLLTAGLLFYLAVAGL